METVLQRPRGHNYDLGLGPRGNLRKAGVVMEIDFAQLNIDGALISELKVEPSKKLLMTLLQRQQDDNKRLIQAEYDLQFNSVRDFRIEVQSEPWLQVVSHAVFPESEYLSESVKRTDLDVQSAKLFHFEIIFAQGRLDIIARGFSFSLFNEIPYAEIP